MTGRRQQGLTWCGGREEPSEEAAPQPPARSSARRKPPCSGRGAGTGTGTCLASGGVACREGGSGRKRRGKGRVSALSLSGLLPEARSQDPENDTSNYDQFNNMDFLCTMENDENGDELYICSNPREAYARIAGLIEYVFKDHQENQQEDTFAGNLTWDEPQLAVENTEKFTDVKMQKSHKRTALGSAESCSDVSEPKYKKIGELLDG
ncbi:PREDICTED: uncharacterized protein LOC104572435 [Tinamus guttatus]|uniref:uncharacterized protein LOC104572435 n=1 Tax=Tinamus guttatus TaxID=94827 RepID=UPI00052E8DE9|nr:PREDICTED: uncharacterized protein LOC104572435 [Tinamus guttatus]